MILKNVSRGHALRIAVGITMLVLVMAGGAGATKFIRNDATGGDCTSFGTWNAGTKTCTMTADIIETIQMESNGTTLDGNGYQTAGSNTDNGVYLSGRSRVTIKNLNVGQFQNGISLVNSNNNYLIGNTVSGNYYGIALSQSSNNVISGNNANSNSDGIFLFYSNNNKLSGNNANSNTVYDGIYLQYSDNNTLSGNNANMNNYHGIRLEYSKINNLTGNKANSNKNYDGIFLYYSSSNRLSGNNANSNNRNGVYLYYSSNSNRLNNNNANSNNGNGIDMEYSSNSNTLTGNNASNNKNGIDLETNSNTLSGNIVSSNSVNGIYLSGSSNKIYNNNFNNKINLVIQTGSNTWNKAKTSGTNIIGGPYQGGNFWAYPNGTGFSQKCADANKDGICNAQYTLDGYNIDYLPLAKYTATKITVISPNGGETWVRGSTQTIKWTYTGNPGSRVKIELMKGGILNRVINSSTSTGSSGSGSFKWRIKSTQTAGSNYKVRVTSTSKPAITDTSNKNFTISIPIICKTSLIHGYSFNDKNGNKTMDSGEAGLSNRVINLKGYDTCTGKLVSKGITTNTTGYFAFKNINPGSYVLFEDYVIGWLPTTDAAYTLKIPSVSETIRKNFGNKKFT